MGMRFCPHKIKTRLKSSRVSCEVISLHTPSNILSTPATNQGQYVSTLSWQSCATYAWGKFLRCNVCSKNPASLESWWDSTLFKNRWDFEVYLWYLAGEEWMWCGWYHNLFSISEYSTRCECDQEIIDSRSNPQATRPSRIIYRKWTLIQCSVHQECWPFRLRTDLVPRAFK